MDTSPWIRHLRGTSFTFYVPATSAPADATPSDTGEVVPGHGRVLVLDDEAPIRRLAADLLDKLGYDAELVEEGREAIARYSAAMESGHRFDAVIMDLTIPGGIGGREAISELLEIDPEAKVIVYSG